MRVISDKDANSGTVQVKINGTELMGHITNSNGKALRNGREYDVQLSNGTKGTYSGNQLTRI